MANLPRMVNLPRKIDQLLQHSRWIHRTG